jgi:hypothetical protein
VAPSSLPSPTAIPTAACTIPDRGVEVVYPAEWSTLAEPPDAACRVFDPEPIVAPGDPADATVAVVVLANPDIDYQAALAAATDPATWDVETQEATQVSGLPATRIEAVTSTPVGERYPEGYRRYLYLVDRGAGGTLVFDTRGTAGETYDTYRAVVDLMAASSTVEAP